MCHIHSMILITVYVRISWQCIWDNWKMERQENDTIRRHQSHGQLSNILSPKQTTEVELLMREIEDFSWSMQKKFSMTISSNQNHGNQLVQKILDMDIQLKSRTSDILIHLNFLFQTTSTRKSFLSYQMLIHHLPMDNISMQKLHHRLLIHKSF